MIKTNYYSDKENVQIAENEYKDYRIRDEVTINDGKTSIGYVSQENDKASGEQSFIITDTYVPPTAPLSERQKVQEIIVIYRGSTSPGKIMKLPGDVYQDWLVNNLSMGSNILGQSQGNPPPQLKSSAETLKNAMGAYPNANVYVYGHSLASMNGQYAVSDLSKNELHRVKGVFFIKGQTFIQH